MVVTGVLDGGGRRVALVCATFNDFVTKALRDGALAAFKKTGVALDDILEIWVPGALELALATKKIASSLKYDGIVVIGAVIRGETAHFDVVVSESASQITQLGLQYDIPITNAILTTESFEQAIDRSGGKSGNKGFEAAMALIETIDTLAKLDKELS